MCVLILDSVTLLEFIKSKNLAVDYFQFSACAITSPVNFSFFFSNLYTVYSVVVSCCCLGSNGSPKSEVLVSFLI